MRSYRLEINLKFRKDRRKQKQMAKRLLIKQYIQQKHRLSQQTIMQIKSKNSLRLMMQLSILCILSLGVLSISNKVFYPVSSNMGYQTDYYMSFTTDQTYSLTDLNIKISVPIQYDLSQITNDMECYMSPTGLVNTYYKMPNGTCFTQQNSNTSYSIVGDIIIKVDALSSTIPLYFVFRNIINPVASTSSYFGLAVRSGTHLLQSDQSFKMLTFTPLFAVSTNGISISTYPLVAVVGQGTTYFFKFQTNIAALTSSYDIDLQNMEIRVVFPSQYSSSNAICSMMQLNNITGTYSAIQVETTSTPSKSYSIECNKIRNLKSSYMYINPNTSFYELYLKIQNMQNPLFSSTFSNFNLEISRGGRNQIIEKISFPTSSIQIQPEQFDGNVNQTHMMRNATTVYYFYFTHDLDYANDSMIRVSIGNNSLWTINSVNLMFGFTNSKNFTSVVTNAMTGSFVEITNFGLASKKLQQIISMNLTSSNIIGDHKVIIEAFTYGKLSGTWSGVVELNSTWGSFNMLHFSAVQQPIKLPVGRTGPLEFTLFLNYELPQSQNVQNGSMIISFTPPIATPNPDIYGKVKCYLFATLQAADCIYDNSDPTKTKITIVSPPYNGFQYSQIPITITTQGGIDENHIGLTISPIVERYKFDVEFYLYNSSVIPSEVLYTNWLADAVELSNTMTATSLSWEINQITAVHFDFITPLMITPEERMMFQFIPDSTGRSAWHPTLGYNADTIYKQFPCVVVGLPGQILQCDLYTYVNTVGPYNKLHINSKSLAPFLMLYGFTTPVTLSSSIQIYFPGIRISNNLGAEAMVSFSILQQTPGDTEPYIELYHQNVNIFRTIPAPTITPSTSVVNPTMIQVQTSNIYSMTWNPVTNPNVAYVRYDFTKQLPSMNTFWGACTGTCYSSGYPNNWIVQIPALGAAGSVASPHTLTTSTQILAMPYINSLVYPAPVHITTYSANGQTLQQIDIINDYIPQPMSGTFTFIDPIGSIYSGLKEWYNIGFTSAAATTSAYPFIRLKLGPQLQFADPQQCNSTTLLPFNVTGIQCSIIPGTNNHQMLVYNIKNINPSTAYSVNVRLRTTLTNFTVPITPTVDVYVHHNQSIANGFDPCYVEDVIGVQLGSVLPLMAAPEEFTIDNPQILNEEIRVNYIGRMFIDFQSSAAITTNLKITLLNHRYNTGFWNTQHGPIYDPMVCMINGKRFYCQQTYQPLTITIPSVQLSIGSNRVQLDTQYVAPYNGIVFPAFAGNYEIRMETINPITNILTTQHTFYVYVHPPELEDIEIAAIVKDINTESVYLVNFTIADPIAIPLANHAAGTYSRIFIEFPTIINGQRVFQDNLGGYQGLLNERVGCSFLRGAQYVLPENASTWLQCRLIPPQIYGAPVKIQVINFGAFSATLDSLGLFIFKVWNPAIAIDSFQITVKINNYDVATGHVFPIFESDYVVFLDPNTQNTNPIIKPSTQGDQTSFFDSTQDVGNAGTIRMTAQTITPSTTMPYYMLVKLPSYLPVANEQLTTAFPSCPTSNFVYCVSSPDVNYALIKAFTNSSSFTIMINNYPLGISQTDSKFQSMIIESGRWTGNIEYTISANKRWLDIRGLSTFNFIEPVGLSQKLVMYKERFHVEIQFTTKNYIPPTGTVEICFPTSVTKIYPYCRSTKANGSQLISQSGPSGEVGCDVQNTNHWVITGFTDVPAGAIIKISGYIDLPTVAGPLGLAQIITYADNHPTNIYTNGSQIDYVQPNFNLIVGNVLAMNPNQNVFLTQRDVVRSGDIADFRILFKLPTMLTTTGFIRMDFSKKDINGKGSGFVYTPTEKKVCEFIDIATENRIGCQVTAQTDNTTAGESYVQFTMITFENLLTTTTYELRLTTQKYSQPGINQGIRYPTIPSTYKIETYIQYTSSSSPYTNQHLYMDVYGPQFSYVKVTQYNYIQNEYNPYWFEISPNAAVPITTKHQIIIEFPTLSNDGVTPLFRPNLGLSQYVSGDVIAMDIFDSFIGGATRGNDFMSCVIHHGDTARGIPVKVVCGGFLVTITSADTLRFAIAMINPMLTATQISAPILIYSADPYLFTRTQFNMVNGAGYIFDKPNILSKLGFPSTLSNQQQFPNDQFYIGDAHTNALQIGDAYVIRLNFPIRVNTKIVGGCVNKLTPTIVYGNAYYHQNLRTIVCLITTTAVPAQLTPTAATLGILGFYTPWYYLTTTQQSLYAIAHYYSLDSSEVVVYTDPFPNLPPRWTFLPTPTITMSPVLPHNTMCQRNDYTFTIQLEPITTTNINLQYTSLIGIVFPLNTTIDFDFFGRDCVEHTSSQIEVVLCQVNQVARTIYIQIVQGQYLNSKKVVIQTKGLAIRNPCIYTAFNTNQMTVNFFSWYNITASQQRSNSMVYMTMNSMNLPSVPYPFVYEVSNVGAASTNYFYPFAWVDMPNEKYFNEFYQFKSSTPQYSPFKFDLLLTTAIAAGSVTSPNRLTLHYGSNFDILTPEDTYLDDMKQNTELCYLRNTRVTNCVNDFANRQITMYFAFTLPVGEWINVYFSIQDPQNLESNGFHYIGSYSDMETDVTLELQQNGAANSYLFKANPFIAKQTNQNPPLSTMPQRTIIVGSADYANSITSQLNVIDMTLTLNDSSIKGLKFQIPLVDQFGVQIFSNPSAAFFGLNDGEEYPCGNNDPSNSNTGRAKCYIFNGDNTNMGQPTTIIMTDFMYTTQIRARLLLYNPADAGKWVTVNVRAYKEISGGGQSSLIGQQYVGYWLFPNIFQTVAVAPVVSSASASTTTIYPSPIIGSYNPLWMDTTTWIITGTSAALSVVPAGQYIIFSAYLNNYDISYTEPQFCKADFPYGNAQSDDIMVYRFRGTGSGFQKVFFVKKFTSPNWLMQYFKCKHYLQNFQVNYHFSKTALQISTYTIPYTVFDYTPYAPSTIQYYEMMQNRVEVQIDISGAMNMAITNGFKWEYKVNYVLRILTDGAMPFTGATSCQAVGGFVNKNGLTVSCIVISVNEVVVHGFNEILKDNNGLYSIRVDVITAGSSMNAILSTAATTYIYAGEQAYNGVLHNFFQVSSYGYSRQVDNWLYTLWGWSYSQYSQAWPFTTATSYSALSNYYQSPQLNVNLLQAHSIGSVLNLKIRLQPIINLQLSADYSLRFYLEGINAQCGSITVFNSFNNYGNSANLLAGVTCVGKNQFYFQSYLAGGYSVIGLNSVFQTTEWVQLTIQMTTANFDPTYTRDWIGVKVFSGYTYQVLDTSVCCYWSGLSWICPINCYERFWIPNGFGEGYLTPNELFASGVTLTALSNLANTQTQLQIIMYSANVPIGPSTTNKFLLFQFNTGSTTLFNYINNTGLANYPIECNCIVSPQSDFSGASTFGTQYNNLNCYLKFPQGANVYTSISVDLNVPINSYAQCYFPGFSSSGTFTVTAKLSNQGVNQANYPNSPSLYGSVYQTVSSSYTFTTGSPIGSVTITESPQIYNGGTLITIGKNYNTMGGYSLTVQAPFTLANPILYINFQKGGPIPETTLCTSAFQFCRVYSKYRNIIVAQYNSNVQSVTFSVPSLSVPVAQQPNLGSDYNMIAYVKSSSDGQYTFGNPSYPRANPANLVPSTTNFSVFPDRITSNNYQGFTSNLVLSFKLEGHQVDSFWYDQPKIEISYDQSAYISASKGCIVAMDSLTDDPKFQFFCQIDAVNKVIRIQNRYYNQAFSATGLMQVVIGVVNQAQASPITFTLKMYKWWRSTTDYGLLIQSSTTYTPYSVAATQLLQSRNQMRQYPFYTRYYSDVYAPFRMAFKFPPTMVTPLSYVNSLTSFFIFDDFQSIGTSFNAFECYLKEFSANPLSNIQTPQTNGYRNYRQNTQYFFVPTYCSYLNSTALKIEIPRNRDLNNAAYYELVIMPTSFTQTGFTNAADALAKLVTFPATTAEHLFNVNVWTKAAFTLNSIWIVTTRPLQPNAIQLTFTTNFADSLDFPDHYIEVVFNNLDLSAVNPPYNQMGATVPCSFSPSFAASTLRKQPTNCIVTYVDSFHQVIKIRVQHFKQSGSPYKLSFDYFFLPSLTNLLEMSNTFTVCMTYWSAPISHERCFGEIFIIDGITNTAVQNLVSSFLPLPAGAVSYGFASSPKMQVPYPVTTTSQRSEKIMIQITGGYSAMNAAPLSFSGSTVIWYNPMINLYIQKLPTTTSGTNYPIVISKTSPPLVNPQPYQMADYINGCNVQLWFFSQYQPNTIYNIAQTPYSTFQMVTPPLVTFGGPFSGVDDIKVLTTSGTEAVVKIPITITQPQSTLALHLNNRFEIQFDSNVVVIERCWVNSVLGIQYSLNTICTPKPSNPLILQLLNFYSSNTNANLVVYVMLKIASNTTQMTSHLYSSNGQQEFTSTTSLTISSVATMAGMTAYNYLSWTESHYVPGYYEQIITPLTHSSNVNFMYFSIFLPETQVQIQSVFTIILNSSLAIQPKNITNTRLICEWMKVSNYGRTYATGKFSFCIFTSPNIIINAPVLNLPQNDGSGNRIPYLLKIRQEYPANSAFFYPTTSQVQEIILQSATGGNLKTDTLRVRPYEHFNGMSFKHTSLTINQLDTYTVQFAAPSVPVSAGLQYVLTLQVQNKYMPDTLGIQSIYTAYGDDSTNSTIITNNMKSNLLYQTLPNKWFNGIPYSCWTSPSTVATQTFVEKSADTIRINLLLPAAPTSLVWKIPLLMNPSTIKPFRMNLTLWSYQLGATQGSKQLFYQIINQYITKNPVPPTAINYTITAAAQAGNHVQTSTNSMNIQFNSYTPTPDDIIEIKIIPRAVAFINYQSFKTPADTSYSFYFFQNINFLIAQKLSTTNNIINIGTMDVSNLFADEYGYQWINIDSASTMQTMKTSGSYILNMQACVTSPTITYTLMSGKDNIQASNFEVMFTFTTSCIIPVNSTLQLQQSITDLQFINFNDQTYCETTFRSQDCWVDSVSKNLMVKFDVQIPVGTVIKVTAFARSKSRSTVKPVSGQIYAIPSNPLTLVDTMPAANILPPTSTSTLSTGSVFPLIIKPLYQNTYSPMTGTFTPGNHLPFTFVQLISPFIKLIDSNQTFYYQANTTGSPYHSYEENFELNWIKELSQVNSNVDSKEFIPPNGINSYALVPFTQYKFMIGSQYEGIDLNNFLIGPVGSYYNFEYHTDKQIAFHEVYPLPVAQVVTVINPLTQVNQQTVLGIKFTSTLQAILPGDIIEIQLDSFNLIEGMYLFNNNQPQCVQFVQGVLTSTLPLVCEVVQYPNATSNTPLLIRVYPTNNVAANTPINVWISPVFNSPNILVAGVIVKVLRFCSGEQLCTMYEGRGWYKTTNSLIITNYGTSGATFTPSPTTVLQTGSVHSYTFNSISLATSFLQYPQNYNTIMSPTCTIASGTCLIFPNQKLVVTVTSGVPAATTSLTLNGMTNGIYEVPQQRFINMKVASSTNLDLYSVIHPPLTTRQVMPLLANAPNTFTITPTQNSGGIFLRDYWNTAKLQIKGLYSSQFVHGFYIVAPPQVTQWDPTYCNATIGAPSQLPYPTRLQCKQITNTTIQIKIPQGVYYQPGISQTQILTVYAKFWIQDFPQGTPQLYIRQPVLSGNFNAYGSFSSTNFSSNYYITQAFTPISISQHKTPYIGQSAFNTDSFEDRMASINQPTTFDILMDPYTTDPIGSIELIIPDDFKYPNVQTLDMCQLIYRQTTNLTCLQTRRNNQTIITMNVESLNYDDGPRILKIASQNISNWFISPNTPGSLYNMTISLYSPNGTLLQQQTTMNSSRIKGIQIQQGDIKVSHGLDELQQQIYDITFNISSVPIKQGYLGILSPGDYYSQIRVNFQNTQGYNNSLGGYYNHLDHVGCVTSLTSINKEISCIFDKGTDINDEPTIIISNYEQIEAYSTIRLSFANILNLPQSLRNTLGVSVKYHKVGDQTQNELYSYMMYDHQEVITTQTTPLNPFTSPTVLSITYPGQTIVSQPATFQIVITPSIAITDYIVIQFPKNGISDQYWLFNTQCTGCGSFQIFHRADLIRIYPASTLNAGQSVTFTFTGFPSTEYVVQNPSYPIIFQGYSALKIVQYQTVSINFNMQGCQINSGIIASTSPYGGDTGVIYTFQVQVNSSQLTRVGDSTQLDLTIMLPNSSSWFTPSSYCQVQSPLICTIDTLQQRIIIKNLFSYNQPTIKIDTYNLLNPAAIINATTLTFYSTIFEETPSTAAGIQQNIICMGSFNFTYLPSAPNTCMLTLSSQHSSTIKQNVLSFGIVCEQAIKDRTVVYMRIPTELKFNNLLNTTYNCWTDDPSILLDSRCQIVFMNGEFYLKTMSELNIALNVLQINLNVVVNNPLSAGTYSFGSTLQHSGNFYSQTNNVSLPFYSTQTQPQLNTSISLSVLPKQASAQAIYILRVPTQSLSDQMLLNFGNFGVQLNQNTKISFYQPMVNSTSPTSNSTDWLDSQSYFSLLQYTYNNSLNYTQTTRSDLSSDVTIDTGSVNNSQSGWTYIMLSPIINPSSSSSTDNLTLEIFDRIAANSTTYNTLVSSQTIPMNLNIQQPPTNIYQTKYSVVDNDILSSTVHTVTFTLDYQLFANQNGTQNIQFVIDPPTANLQYLQQVQACLYYPDLGTLVECQQCVIGQQELSFKPLTSNLTFSPEIPFTLVLSNITNPENETTCDPQSATLKDYIESWFKLKIFINQQLEFQSVYVGMTDNSNNPCVQFENRKGDILNNLPIQIAAGFETPFNISISQATANLRVFLSTNDTDLTFSTNIIYFNSYEIMYVQLMAIASPNAVNKSVLVTITHQESNALNSFREPQPVVVKIVAGKKQTVTVNQMASASVGYDIQVPIILSKPSLNNMSLLLTIANSTVISSYMPYFTISPLQVPIPALTNSTYFTVRYNGTKIPPTLNISLQLISQNILTHYLLQQTVYLYFSIDPKYQTLPPVMKMNLLWSYKSNNDLVTKTVYYCCADNQNVVNYDYLKPVIIDQKVGTVTATKAQITIWTRNQATLFYQLRQRGTQFELQNKTSTQLRQDSLSLSTQTFRNSSNIVNPYQILNFTNLQHETDYYLFVSAFDAFGDSENVTIVNITTGPLSSAITFNLNCFQIYTDEVMIVRALADILKIDMRRIKVVSSYKNLQKSFTLNADNQPVYPHQIVISPSLTDDSITPEELFKTLLLNNPKNQGFLKEKIPSWTGTFDPISIYQGTNPYYEVDTYRAGFQQVPYAQRISYYNVTIGIKLWTKGRVSAVILVQQGQTPDNSIDFINKKPIGIKVSQLPSAEQQLSPDSKQIYKGLNQYNQKLEAKYTFTGLTNQDGEGIVFFKGLKPGSYCKVYITSTNPETYQPTASLLNADVYLIEFNMMWNPNLNGDNNLILDSLKKKNPKMFEVITQYNANENNEMKKMASFSLKKAQS